MSSFVVSKESYIRAAGYIAGIADNKNQYRDPAIRLWNYQTNKVYTTEDYKAAFAWLFWLNAKSVQIQYNDPEPEADQADYSEEFKKYFEKGKRLYHNKPALRRSIYEFHHFVSGCLYQIEDRDCEMKFKGFIYRLLFELDKLLPETEGIYSFETWAEFNLDNLQGGM